ncbi:MAG TPA: exosortase/archaeosortase family protein [Kiritimatiellia bacterium]|nr:exosortase/archaeosortase family protein [Kiritimatiellia bacterium]HPS06948.1 exosortase/archaeosortase family protein [Kiritimatiellia bacterium]
MKWRMGMSRWLALAVIAVAAGFNYRYMIDFTMVMFASPLEDMSHGWLVPFVSLYVLWAQRKALRVAAGEPCWRGAVWVALFLVIAWFGGRGGQSRLEQVSFIGLVWAVPYAFWGRGVGRLMRFPAAYLVFTIPVSSFIDFFTIHLRILSSSLATGILNGVGVAVERSGTALFSRVPGAEFNVDVADPCSGIRSLFALMALTAAYAYFTQKTVLRKWALFFCSLPIAMIGNMARIMSICLVAMGFGQEAATGYYHDYSGYVIFLVGVLLMIKSGEWIQACGPALERLLPWVGAGEQRTGEAGAGGAARAGWKGVGIVGAVCALGVAVFIANLSMPSAVYDSASFVADALPEKVADFVSDVPWFCHNPQCLEVTEEQALAKKGRGGAEGYVCPSCGGALHKVSLGEESDLPKDTVILKRNYRAVDGLAYAVSVVIGGRQRNSIHRAELCLPAQGFAMLDAERTPLRLSGGKTLLVRKITARRTGGGTISLVYWFLSRERECCSHTQRILLDVWDRSVHNRINRWVMVAVSVSSELQTPESMERFEGFLSDLCPRILPDR